MRHEDFVDCWDLLYDLKILAARPTVDQEVQLRLEMLIEIYSDKFSKYWKFLQNEHNLS
jgi:hypothetical protein